MGISKNTVVPVANDVYERLGWDADDVDGDILTDIEGLTIEQMEDYFLDADPAEYL